MALNLGSMFAWIGADTSGLDAAERRMRRFVGNVDSSNRRVSSSAGAMGKAIAAAISIATIRSAANLADEYKGVESRIRNITKEANTFHAVQSRIEAISLGTGTDYVANAKLYANIDRSLPELGGTQKQAIQLTTTLQQLAVISGASSSQMKDGMLQFGQAMAAGIVRAEEWNSIMENIPEVGVRIAKGLGMSVGELRLAILDGKVLSKDVFAALLKQSEGINEEFREMPTRLGQGSSALKTGAMAFLGELDKSLGVTTGIADAMKSLGIYLSGDFSGQIFQVTEMLNKGRDSLALWKSLISEITQGSEGLGSSFSGKLMSAISFISDALIKMPINLRFLGDMATTLIAEFLISADQLMSFFKTGFDVVWQYIKAGAYSLAASITESLSGVVTSVISNMQGSLESLGSAAEYLGMENASAVLKGVTDDVGALSAGAKESAESWRSMADESRNAAHLLAKSAVEQSKASVGAKELLKEEKYAAIERYNSELLAMDEAAIAREIDHEAKLHMLQGESELAEKLFLEEQARAAKVAVVKDKAGTKSKGASGQDKLAKQYEQERIYAERALIQLENSLMSEREIENQYYAESLAQLRQAEELKIASIMPYHELRERLEQDHQDRILEIEQRRLDQQLSNTGYFFSNIASLQDSENKRLADIGKAAAIVEIAINTARAAMSSYAFGAKIGGPFLGAAFAAAAGVAGGVQMAAVRSAKATGGPVGMGGAYRVNEHGPEMLSVGGDDFLMMGSQGGSITPSNGIGNSPEVVNKIIIQNLPGQTATVSKGKDDSTIIRIAVDTAKAEIANEARNGNGTVVPAILRAGGIKRKAS